MQLHFMTSLTISPSRGSKFSSLEHSLKFRLSSGSSNTLTIVWPPSFTPPVSCGAGRVNREVRTHNIWFLFYLVPFVLSFFAYNSVIANILIVYQRGWSGTFNVPVTPCPVPQTKFEHPLSHASSNKGDRQFSKGGRSAGYIRPTGQE